MSIASTITKGLATIGGTAYDYLTPGKGSSRLTDYGYSLPSPAKTSSPTPNYGTGSTTGATAPDYSSIYNDAYNAAVKAATTPIPRMVTPNLSGINAQAASSAQASVAPIYQQMMATFLAGQAEKLSQQQADVVSGKSALDTALTRNLADTQLQRTRATEDNTTNVNDINATQAYNERTGGLTYDAASRALNSGLGASGTAESGLGQGQVEDAKTNENLQSNEQLRQSTNQVKAANTLMSRTFEDLGTSDTRNTEDTATGKNQLDVNLENFINDQQQDLTSEQQTESIKQAGDIQQATAANTSKLIDDWLASLPSQGYTNQEVANAASIYKQ